MELKVFLVLGLILVVLELRLLIIGTKEEQGETSAFLFNMDVELENDLKKGIIPERLKKMFESKGCPLLYPCITKEGGNFKITDKERIYIAKHENIKLKFYQQRSIIKFLSGFINLHTLAFIVSLVSLQLNF